MRPLITACLVVSLAPATAGPATGSIAGAVRDQQTGERLAGVTVVATSPILEGQQSAITDGQGRYRLGALPPGAYELTFYYADTAVTRKDIEVAAKKTTRVDVALEQSSGEAITIQGTAPSIDITSTSQGVTVDGINTQNIPAPGRQFAASLQDEPPGAEHYVHHGTNPWTATSKDRFSTFAVDVDTASYAIVRKKILAGVRPPPASVRVEELVNYFGYDYPGPGDGRPFAVHMDAAPSPIHPGRELLRVAIQAKKIPPAERKPANLVFLVDVSGSMAAPDKLGLALRSLRILVDHLDERDTVALVTYAGSTRVVLEPTRASNKGAIMSAIDDLGAGGSTAMADGIKLAYDLAARNAGDGVVSRVIVLSDGDANVGLTGHDAILETVAAQVDRGVTLTTVGFGMGNYKDHMMEQLANRGDGQALYIDGISEARRVFAEQLGGTLEVVAKDVKIQVELDPARVRRYRLIGYENRAIADEDFRDDRVDAGEIGAGHRVTALYELELARGARGASLATVRVRAMKPRGKRATEHVYRFDPRRHHASFDRADADFRFATAVAAAAEILRGSDEVGRWTLADVIRVARAATSPGQRDRLELVELLERAAGIASGEYTFANRRFPRGGYLSVGGSISGLVVRDRLAPDQVTAMPALRIGVGRGATDLIISFGASRGAADATLARGATPIGDALSIYSAGAMVSRRLLRGAALQPVGGLGLETLVITPEIGGRRMALAALARLGVELTHRTRSATVAVGIDATGHLPVAQSELMPMSLSSLVSLGSYLDLRF